MLIFININPFFGGRLLAVSYITIASLNPLLSILVIIISDILICILGFHFAQYLRKFNFVNKRLRKINGNGKWTEHGAYIGFYVGQLFIGTFFISLILGLIQNRKNDFLYFYVPLITSIIFYTFVYYYLSLHSINLMKNWL
jgi:hypothetical protein